MNVPVLKENIDYYVDANGMFVFTEKYLLQRGYCCTNGCRHCPYKSLKPESNDTVKGDQNNPQL